MRQLCGNCAGLEKAAAIILDGNSQIRLHESMMTKVKAKIPVHAVMHSPWVQYVVRRKYFMKAIVSLMLLTACHYCLAQTDTNLIAAGDWSKPVSDGKENDTATLRGRLLVYDVYDSNIKSTLNLARMYDHARVYLELQHLEPENTWARPVEIYYDPGFDFYTLEHGGVFEHDASGAISNGIHHQPSLHLQMRDGNDKPYTNECITINGSDPAPCWIILPYDATVRLRADIYTLADSKKPNGLEIFVNGGRSTIPPHATNDYYLCGTFSPPTNHPSPLNYHIWQGTLNLPRVKIPSR